MRRVKRLTALMLAFFIIMTTSGSNISAAAMTEQNQTERQAEISIEEIEKPQVLVNYLVIEEAVITTPGIQRIMLGIGNGETQLDSVVLSYTNRETGESYEAETVELLEDFAMFQMEYTNESYTGTYALESITYTVGGVATTTSFAEMGIDAVFGVNKSIESTPDDILLTEEEVAALAAETEMSIVSFDEEGNVTSEENIEQAMENAGCINAEEALLARKGATDGSGLIVVLDPGHGGSDPGAQKNGIVEKAVNLKIAQYCKAELENYAGITVYMTRESDVYLDLAQRAQVAIDKKADVFISLHNNSNVSSKPAGASVYYPNSNYNPQCGEIGKSLASIIESKLTDLGLASGGILIRNSENGTKYPDGSLSDYYGVIRRCKENGIPGLIVEHAYVSNASDAQIFLSTDEQLKKLGVADATAIAEYYGLTKGFGFSRITSISSTTIDLNWPAQSKVDGYVIYRSTSAKDGFVEVARVDISTTTTWKDAGLTPGTKYYYKIRTYTKEKTEIKYGKYSPVASTVTTETVAISSIKSKSSKKLVISWATVNNAASYEIYRANKENGNYKKIATVTGVNQVNYTDSKVKVGKLYYYKIRSVGVANNVTVYSDFSAVASGRTAKVPANLSVTAKDSNTIKISWETDANASGYVIKRAASAKGKYKKVATISDAVVNYYEDTTVKANKTYYYIIQAFNYNNGVKGYSGFTKASKGKTLNKTKITKIRNVSSVKQEISWKKTDGANGYIIYQSAAKAGPYKKIKTINSGSKTSYAVSGLNPGTRYYYKIKTRNKANGKKNYGSDSVIRSAWTPKKPVITSVAGSTGKKIQISWEPVGGAASYSIYRAEAKKGLYKKIGSVNKDAISFVDKELNLTKTYYYKVAAEVKGYKTPKVISFSKVISGTPISKTDITAVTMNGNGQLQVNWVAVGDISGYQIYRSTEQNGKYDLVNTISDANVNHYVDTSAVSGTAYYYKIVLVNVYNGKTIYGEESSAVSGMLLAAPQNVMVAPMDENRLDIAWTAVKGAQGYIIYRSGEANGAYAQIGTVASSATTLYSDTTVEKGVTYYYKICSYVEVVINSEKQMRYGLSSSVASASTLDYSIMGAAEVTQEQMVSMYKASEKTYPTEVYRDKGAATIEEFCKIVFEESIFEGVKPEVIFAQICHETGHLQFGGQVQAAQCNFGGLGALDSGAAGATFADVRTGIRTQVQHMKAYASTSPLNLPCIDERFSFIKRGSAPYVQQLGNGIWATDPLYDVKLMSYINKIKTS